jgi:hypothetical protein
MYIQPTDQQTQTSTNNKTHKKQSTLLNTQNVCMAFRTLVSLLIYSQLYRSEENFFEAIKKKILFPSYFISTSDIWESLEFCCENDGCGGISCVKFLGKKYYNSFE